MSDMLEKPVPVHHPVPIQKYGKARNLHSRHEHKFINSDEILNEIDKHNQYILTKNHGILNTKVKNNGSHNHNSQEQQEALKHWKLHNSNKHFGSKHIHDSIELGPDINSELVNNNDDIDNNIKKSIQIDQQFKVQSHIIPDITNSKEEIEKTFNFDWDHLPNEQQIKNIQDYNQRLYQKGKEEEEKRLQELRKQNIHVWIPDDINKYRRRNLENYMSMNKNGQMERIMSNGESQIIDQDIPTYSMVDGKFEQVLLDPLKIEPEEKYLEDEYLANGDKSISDNEIENYQQDKFFNMIDKPKTRHVWNILNIVQTWLFGYKLNVYGINIHLHFVIVLMVLLSCVLIVLGKILKKSYLKRKNDLLQNKFYGEIGMNDRYNKNMFDDYTDEIDITIHQQRIGYQTPSNDIQVVLF